LTLKIRHIHLDTQNYTHRNKHINLQIRKWSHSLTHRHTKLGTQN